MCVKVESEATSDLVPTLLRRLLYFNGNWILLISAGEETHGGLKPSHARRVSPAASEKLRVYPNFRLFETMDLFITEKTPVRYLATNLECVSFKPC
jgi:hypothetical protein